jgi:glycosyltransferase involved in cell wall biosynthesis
MVQAMIKIAPQHNYSLYPSFGDFYFDSSMPTGNPYSGRNVEYGPRHSTREIARAFWSDKEVEKLLGAPDIIHSNNFWSPLQIASSRFVYTFHDLGFAVNPAWTTEANRLGCFEGVFRSMVAADWVVANSEATRVHYLSTFPHFPEQRTRVIYPCSRFADSSVLGKRPKALNGIPEGQYWLSVGTIEPRKNQRRLAESYARYLAAGGEPMPLVFAGGKGWLMDDFQSHLSELGIQDRVVMTGYVSDDELIWLYRHCYANLYPSLFEGFGLPVLEGMQFGAPTLASASTSIPEVAGTAAILISPTDVDGWAQAMLRLVASRDERDALGVAAVQQSQKFAWERSAGALLELYEEALISPKRHKMV